MSNTNRPRIALLGFSIECNRFAPVTHEHDFAIRTLLRGEDIVADAKGAAPRMLGEMPGFIGEMDAGQPWEPVPLLLAMTEPNGPVDQAFFDSLMAEWEDRLKAAGKIDGVYCVMHGAGLATRDDDPEGTLQAMVRRVVGPDVPIISSFDLHANVSDTDIDTIDAFIGYRTNPHMDMRERGAESAQVLRRLIGGMKTHIARVRLPIIAPTVTMLTGKDAHNRPYGEMIDLGQELMQQAPWAGRIVNVSVMGGFAYADTAFNGMTVVVTATDKDAAEGLAMEIARAGWAKREKFFPTLTPLEEAVGLAKGTQDRGKPALVFADVADNPGGGGRGNTMYILEAFHAAGVKDALVGVIYDAALAEEAHGLGAGAAFMARFNQVVENDFSKPFSAEAKVVALHPGPIQCRRGIFAGGTVDVGKAAALDIGGITVVVISQRVQCADPAFFEAFGLNIGRARVVVVKSRGHFRGGFDEFFAHGQVIEVDAPGLTTPMLHHFPWQNLPRPAIPLERDVAWPAGDVA